MTTDESLSLMNISLSLQNELENAIIDILDIHSEELEKHQISFINIGHDIGVAISSALVTSLIGNKISETENIEDLPIKASMVDFELTTDFLGSVVSGYNTYIKIVQENSNEPSEFNQ